MQFLVLGRRAASSQQLTCTAETGVNNYIMVTSPVARTRRVRGEVSDDDEGDDDDDANRVGAGAAA